MGFSFTQVYKPAPFRVLGYVISECRLDDFTKNDKNQIVRHLIRDPYSGMTIPDVVFHPSISEVLESDYKGLPPDYQTENGSSVWLKREEV
jgi:hypothetical protein